MNDTIEVERMIPYEDAALLVQSIGGLGGFFDRGQRWKDYLEIWRNCAKPYAEAIRAYVIENKLKHGGDWHQQSERGAFLFNDGTSGTFSFRAWGDLFAAIWSSEEDRDYSYMDFYTEGCVPK